MEQSAYIRGVIWVIFVAVISAMNDALVKAVGTRLSAVEVAFFRFFFSMVTLIPFLWAQGRGSFVTKHWKIHGARSILLLLAIAPWCYGVIRLPLTLVTTLSFTTPFFVLVFASLFLKERVGIHRACATLCGFIGIIVSAQPTASGFNLTVLALLLSACMFASLDILNKKLMIKSEGILQMLFFSALGTTVLSAPFALVDFQMPTPTELFFLFLLGAGANLILICLLKAFSGTELSALQPFRYIELFISGLFGWVFFQEIPTAATLWGAAFIVPATFYIVCYETWRMRQNAALGV